MALKSNPFVEDQTPAVVYSCGFEPCKRPAILRTMYRGSLVNSCRHHYDQLALIEAKKANAAKGLNTIAAKRSACIKLMKSVGANQPTREWAYILKSKFLDGEYLLPVQKKLAEDALGEQWVTE